MTSFHCLSSVDMQTGRLLKLPGFMDHRGCLAMIIIAYLFPCQAQYLTNKPNIFITTNDTDPEYDPFQQIYDGCRFYKLSQYVLYGTDAVSKFHLVYIDERNLMDLTIALTVDEVRKNTIEQNLQKALFFSHYNASGVFPQMIISNTTFQEVITFRSNDSDGISYYAEYLKGFDSQEMVPPFDLILEVPGYSHSIITRRTLIDIQSFTVLRYQLSADTMVTYAQIIDQSEALFPTYLEAGKKLRWNLLESSIQVIANPCIPDFFLLYMMVGKDANYTSMFGPRPIYTYLQIPAYFTQGNDGCWFNITSVYCPNLDYEEECGQPEELVLTNRHLMVLSSKGLFVSNDLTESSFKLSDRYSAAPLARYDLVNPCQSITECFQTMSNPSEENLIFKRKLWYTAFCDHMQYPNNDDIVIFLLEHTDLTAYRNRPEGFDKPGPVRTFTVTFASRPYIKWRPLFTRLGMFEDRYIEEVTGILYNVQMERFDFTMKLSPPINPSSNEDTHGKYVRFILPLPKEEPYISSGYPNISSLWGMRSGFIVQNFSETFQINGVAMNPGTMDILFYGSEMHIAESARPIVYQAMGGFLDPDSMVTGCHFNHPDRFYVCMLNNKKSILVGRVATAYGPVEVSLKSLSEIRDLVETIFAVEKKFAGQHAPHKLSAAQNEVLEYILERAIFTAAFSGKIFMWYFSDPKFFFNKILEHDEQCEKMGKDCPHKRMSRPPALPEIRSQQCSLETCYALPCILPLQLDPLEFQVRNSPTNGALVPFFVDAETLLFYESFVPGVPEDKVRYLTPVFNGQKIFCVNVTTTEENLSEEEQTEEQHSCELYFTHIKALVLKGKDISKNSVIPGFRSAIYATIVHPMPMSVVKDDLKVQLQDNSNTARVVCTDDKFDGVKSCTDISLDDIGGTLYIPGEFSVQILGEDPHIKSAFIGHATYKTTLPLEVKVPSYESFKIKMRTKMFVESVISFPEEMPVFHPNLTFGCNNGPPGPCDASKDPTSPPSRPAYKNADDWVIGDGGCQFEMTLNPNSYVKSSGGKIDLDLHESVSIEATIRPLTSLGKKLLYRPLLIVTQSNPAVLRVSSKLDRLADRQTIRALLKPTGTKQGVSSFVIRSIVSSISCDTPSSFTFMVQAVRKEGRSLEVMFPNMVPKEELLKPGPVYLKDGIELYTLLPVNYRPPSERGVAIPLTKNIYHADPSKPLYNSWYKISKESAEFKQCYMKKSRAECECSDNDKLSSDPKFSDCREKVYAVRREDVTSIKLRYKPRMTNEEQIQEFMATAPHSTVTFEEINGRSDYIIENDDHSSKHVDAINSDYVLSMGEKYYSTDVKFKLRGTGLYHFKATLGRYMSFEDVSAHVMLYSNTTDLDDVMLIMIVVATMTASFLLVFFGFLRVRHSLMSHLPIRIDVPKAKTA